jgi:protein arginine kinase activator
MKCMFCDRQATVHLTDIVNKKKREAHLCEPCARERGLLPEQPGPPIDLKALMGLMMAPLSAKSQTETACPACGLTYPAFKASGRFGCAHDYEAFEEILEPLLERVHRATVHCGKVPSGTRAAVRAAQIEELRTQMKAAAEAEDYEEAARLRDLIRQKETEAEGTTG